MAEWSISPRWFRHKDTGAVATQVMISEIGDWEQLEDPIIIDVHMTAFGEAGELRQVVIPKDRWPEAPNEQLNQVWMLGQNDFQPQQHPSLSVGDIIELDGKKYFISNNGFKTLDPSTFGAIKGGSLGRNQMRDLKRNRMLTDAENASIHRRLGSPPGFPASGDPATYADGFWEDKFAWDEAVMAMSQQEEEVELIRQIQQSHDEDANSYEQWWNDPEQRVQLFAEPINHDLYCATCDSLEGDCTCKGGFLDQQTTTVGFISADQLREARESAWDSNLEDAKISHWRWLKNKPKNRRKPAARRSASSRRGPGPTRQFNGRTYYNMNLNDPWGQAFKMSKAEARSQARIIRATRGVNARVIPTSGGYSVFATRRGR